MRRRLLTAVLLAAIGSVLAPTMAQARTLSEGMCGTAVHRLQHRLVVRSYLPDGYTPGCFDYRTTQAVMALQGWVHLTRDGIAGPQTKAKLRASKTPRPWTGDRHFRHIEIHKGRQVMLIVGKLGRVLRAIHVSTAGPGHVTPVGHFRVYAKSRMSWSTLFHVWLPWANYIHGGIAIHGFASVPGVPASHGCIRVPMPEAPYVYGRAKLNSPVWVR
jgi:L,D-transpeptidase catalytic domain/Putative peptidoglycan binding domain